MKGDNKLYCSNCGRENPLYKLNCVNCKSFLREKVVNINLWETIYKLLESPTEAFKQIIFSEHKNYVIFLTILIAVKFFFHSIFANNLVFGEDSLPENIFILLPVIFFEFTLTIIVISLILKFLSNYLRIETRFKDWYTVIIYSFVLQIFALFLLAPVEYALFGEYWFTFNPSPFQLKEAASYVMIGIEAVLLLWGYFMIIAALIAITERKILSVVIGFIIYGIIFSEIIFTPYFLFKLFM